LEYWSVGRKEKTEDGRQKTDFGFCPPSSVLCPPARILSSENKVLQYSRENSVMEQGKEENEQT
jgi:hypothetical protein